ncbi:MULTISPECIES: type 1 glutamine amidotransferase [Rhodomicrobium]|uniref:type 1 glutamine amidotransferase n=1 Tax=Rhodomicrobium TaxID=1068 RepID=UPI000B4BB407|nr:MULTISPECIES: type 1 glutamine amidotransferase [Rhodomicrobium]
MTLRLLVAEGNTAETRASHEAQTGLTASAHYAKVLQDLAADAVVDICFPADPGANLPARAGLADYDGVAITGSSLNLWRAEPASLAQVDFAREVFDSRVPFFGSCWGLQVAAAAAGGAVRLNPKGREIGFGRKIALTGAGQAHPMHEGRPLAFDAPTVHSDEIGALPPDITVTATNAMTQVQAAEIRHAGGVFWGVQYHPEYHFADIAAVIERYGERLLADGVYASPEALAAHAEDIRAIGRDPARRDLAWQLSVDADVLDPAMRLTEIANWLKHQVRPAQSRRSRG